MYHLNEKVFVNSDYTKIVPEDSVEAAFLLGGPGTAVPTELAERLGLISYEEDEESEDEHVEEEVEEVTAVKELKEAESKELKNPATKSENIGEQERRNLKSAMTFLESANISPESINSIPDAQLLEVDGISINRLNLIRKYYPYVGESVNADNDSERGS